MNKKIIKIHPKDNVAVAVETLTAGEKVRVNNAVLMPTQEIPAGHKVALADVHSGESVIKYGYPIGIAETDIQPGEHVHSHNLKSSLNKQEGYEYEPDISELPELHPRTFMGYRRQDGRIGIRNEVWIIPTVGCVNAVAKAIERASLEFKTDHIDGIYAYGHPYGCSQLGEDQLHTQKLLSGFINHPNAAGCLVVSLGCENNNLEEMKKVLGEVDKHRVKFLVCQESKDEIGDGVALVKELCEFADTFRRTPCDVSGLVLGLKCGGSDGFSGITANPLVGRISDRLIAMGGSSILTEVPEMFGAETILMNRCRSREIFENTVGLIQHFKDYFTGYGEPIDENPSPGNKEGGISTLADKALGCTQKGGGAPVEDVLSYGDIIRKKGLSLLQAPGNDLVASCALAASGAHMVLFTTGRGTPFACPVPTLKIASNSVLAEYKGGWIDYNAGKVLNGFDFDTCTDELFDLILAVAEGRPVKSEKLDKTDIAIFKDGVTL